MDYRERIERARKALRQANCLLIGGGAGLSAAAGLDYGRERFAALFPDFKRKYPIGDMYAAMFYPYPSEEELWAHHARHILVNRFAPDGLPLYRSLRKLAGDNYFVVTTNVDSQFVKAGFDENRLFEVQGNYGLLQCAAGCHDALYDDRALVTRMADETRDCAIPSALVPRCPVCGGPMAVHVRMDGNFVENAGWRAMRERFDRFVENIDGPVVLLELGVGYNTPGIIRFPFEQFVYKNPDAALIRVNRDYPDGPAETAARTIAFTESMEEVIGDLC